jgi:hypothetical protein
LLNRMHHLLLRQCVSKEALSDAQETYKPKAPYR